MSPLPSINPAQLGKQLKKLGTLLADAEFWQHWPGLQNIQLSADDTIYYEYGDAIAGNAVTAELLPGTKASIAIPEETAASLIALLKLLLEQLQANRELTQAVLRQYRESALLLRTATTLAGAVEPKQISEKLLTCFTNISAGGELWQVDNEDDPLLASTGACPAGLSALAPILASGQETKPDMGIEGNVAYLYLPLQGTRQFTRQHLLVLYRQASRPFTSVDLQLVSTLAAIAAAALDNANMARLQQNLSRYMPVNAIENLTRYSNDVFYSAEQPATILFADLRGFTPLTEKLGALATVKLLNSWFTEVVDAVRRNNGIVDKFLGDGLLAVFGIPNNNASVAINSLITAQQILAATEAVAASTGYRLKVGVGIGTGSVISGNIGSQDRLDYTVIGSPVNRAAKLQLFSKETPYPILIDQKTFEKLPAAQQQIAHNCDYHGVAAYGFAGT